MSDGILLSDLEIALNDVVAACIQACNIHTTAAEACEDADLARTLEALAKSRRETAERIGEYLAAHGEGPNKPTEERELIRMVMTRAKSALSGDHVAALLEDCITEEEKVREMADAALAQGLDTELRAQLRELRTDADRRIGSLEAHIGHDRG